MFGASYFGESYFGKAFSTETLGTLYESVLLDTLGLTDSLAYQYFIGSVLTDTLGITDSNDRVIDYARVTSDTLGFTDLVSRSWTIGVVLSDTEGLTDSIKPFIWLRGKTVVKMEIENTRPSIAFVSPYESPSVTKLVSDVENTSPKIYSVIE